MDIPNIVNVKMIKWPDGSYFGHRIVTTTEKKELYFTIDWWNYYCRADPDDSDCVIITHVIPRSGMFTSKSQAINRNGETL